MRNLRLVGLSADGRQVVLVDDTGAEFATPADDRLRAALRGDRARLGQLEIEMDSALRPRDIQARIRAGDTPETVAGLAQVSVDRIMPYDVPVLAERQHIAELARRSHVRRKGNDGPSRALADVVAERLQGRGVDALAAEWDAWRREDGRWAIQASYHSGERECTSRGPQPRESGQGGERRLSAVPDGDDLLTLSDDERDDLTAVVRAVREPPEPEMGSASSAGTDDVADPHRVGEADGAAVEGAAEADDRSEADGDSGDGAVEADEPG